jgi:ribosomal protein L11 methyltransferase
LAGASSPGCGCGIPAAALARPLMVRLLIGKSFVVARISEDSGSGERLPIVLAHGRAMGSGEHETTRSCLEELEDISPLRDARVLDLGSGTGILAVAAARMGARSVMALDPNPEAIQATAATARINGMAGTITPVQGEIGALRNCRFDLILANLYGDVLLLFVSDIAALLAPGGYLVASGIQFGDAYDIKRGFTGAGCTLLKDRYLEDYCTLVFRREQP